MRRVALLCCLGTCLILAACNSDPSSSTSSPSSPSGTDEAAALQRKVEHIEGLLGRGAAAGRILDELMSALPDRAWLTEVAYESGKVQVKGNALSNNLVADYLSRLDGSPFLTNIALRSSAMKMVGDRELQEFALEALTRVPGDVPAPAGVPIAARLEGLLKALPSRQDTAEMLRELQRLALESGLQMTSFAPGAEVAGEFTVALPVAIEVMGDRNEIRRYLLDFSALPHLWIVESFAFKAVSGEDPRSQVRASITARTYLAL